MRLEAIPEFEREWWRGRHCLAMGSVRGKGGRPRGLRASVFPGPWRIRWGVSLLRIAMLCPYTFRFEIPASVIAVEIRSWRLFSVRSAGIIRLCHRRKKVADGRKRKRVVGCCGPKTKQGSAERPLLDKHVYMYVCTWDVLVPLCFSVQTLRNFAKRMLRSLPGRNFPT